MEGDAAKPEAIAAWNHFNPLPPHGGRLAATAISTMPSIFQSTPSAWRETTKNKRTRNILKNFNPLPPHGGRPAKDYATAFEKDISIHSLRMEGDRQKKIRHPATMIISIHSLRMEGDRITLKVDCQESISIHSLRMEGDSSNATVGNYLIHISIHSLRMEGDSYVRFSTRRTGHFNPLPPHGGRHAFKYLWRHEKKFQSTPSAWRETNSHCVLFWNADNFNPLPPHGGRLQKDVNNYVFRFISIHSLRMEGDNTPYIFSKASFAFQSTPSAWRETRSGLPPCGGRPVYAFIGLPLEYPGQVSLHAEGDSGTLGIMRVRMPQVRSPSMRRETFLVVLVRRCKAPRSGLPPCGGRHGMPYRVSAPFPQVRSPSMRRETAKLHRKAFFISPILVQSCKKGCKRLHSAPEKMVFFEKREKNLVRNLQHLSVRL